MLLTVRDVIRFCRRLRGQCFPTNEDQVQHTDHLDDAKKDNRLSDEKANAE